MFRTPKAHKERKNHKYDFADKVPISAPEFHELHHHCMLTNQQQLLYDLIVDNLIFHVNQQSGRVCWKNERRTMAKQSETSAATKKAFVDAFCMLYGNKSIEKITVQELTRKAGYNRCTFYQYFKDAYDLLNYIEDETLARFKKAVDANLNRVDFSDLFIKSFSNITEETENYTEMLLCNQNGAKFAERAKAAIMKVIMDHFKISEDDEKAVYLLEYYLAGVISVASRWLRSGQKMPIEELGKLIHSLLTEGLLSALKNTKTAR